VRNAYKWYTKIQTHLATSVWDFILLYGIYTLTTLAEPFISPAHVTFPYPIMYSAARFALWSAYGFSAGLVATGLWVIAHECGHQAFSESKFINHTVGWVLHSASVIIIVCFFSVSLLTLLTVLEFLTIRGAFRMQGTMPPRHILPMTKYLYPALGHSSACPISTPQKRTWPALLFPRKYKLNYWRLLAIVPLLLLWALPVIWSVIRASLADEV
jgi:hypothetical protein